MYLYPKYETNSNLVQTIILTAYRTDVENVIRIVVIYKLIYLREYLCKFNLEGCFQMLSGPQNGGAEKRFFAISIETIPPREKC